MVYRNVWLIVVLVGVFVLLVGLLLTGAAIAREDGQSCTVPGDYGTIQAAVDDAGCGVVKVGRGTFAENVVISRTVRIEGQGASNTIVDGRGSGEVVTVQAYYEVSEPVTMTVILNDLHIVNGAAGIFNEAAVMNFNGYGSANLFVNISRCAIDGNAGSGVINRSWEGGRTEVTVSHSSVSGNLSVGIDNAPAGLGIGNLTVINSLISDNADGGIASSGCFKHLCTASLQVSGSTISGNSGSGIVNGLAADATVTNSSISDNKGEWVAGIVSCGRMVLNSSTVSGNSAGTVILGSDNPYGCRGAIDATHSIVANSESYEDCILEGEEGSLPPFFNDNGHNIIEDGNCITDASSRAGDPLLGPLARNGGHTPTHALLRGSMAIDGGDMAVCPEKDQRGYSRPADGDEDGTAECDIGSFELRHFLDFFHLPIISGGGNN